MFSHILVPLDESKLSELALASAREIIAPNGKITLVYVLDEVNAPPNRIDITEGELHQRTAEEHARKYLEDRAASLRESALTVTTIVESGRPAECIVDAAATHKDIELIVMSTHGRSGFSRWIMGSVTQKVLAAAHCPVLVIPAREGTSKTG